MRNVARPFAVLLSIGWIAFWGVLLYLMWRPEYRLALNSADLTAVGDIATTGITRVLVSLLAVAAIVAALPVFTAAFLPQRGRVVERTTAGPHVAPRETPTDYRSELSDLHARVDRHERELRALRGTQPTTRLHTDTESDHVQAA